MRTFKETLARDVENVFLNVDEFADCHNINGRLIPCIIDKAVIEQFTAQRGEFEGVFNNVLTVYIRSGEIRPPVVDSMFRIDGSRHIVRSASEEDGMLVIVCEAVEQ